MIHLILAEFNWFDLVHYSHLGQPGNEKYHGAPLFFVFINFAIFLSIVLYFVIPLLKKQLRSRHDLFVEKSEKLKKEHQNLLNSIKEVEIKLENLDDEILKMQKNIEENIKQFEKQIMEHTHQYIQSRHRETENQIAIKKLRMQKKLRETILSQIVDLTYKKVKLQITSDLQKQLLQNTIKALDKKAHHG